MVGKVSDVSGGSAPFLCFLYSLGLYVGSGENGSLIGGVIVFTGRMNSRILRDQA